MPHSHLNAILHLLNAHDLLEQRLSGDLGAIHGLSLREALLLLHLQEAPARKLSRVDLSRRMYSSASTITRMVAPLEKIGLVSRQSDPRDARLAFVVLTRSGSTKAREVRDTLSRFAGSAFLNQWTDQEVATLTTLIGRLTANTPGDLTRHSPS